MKPLLIAIAMLSAPYRVEPTVRLPPPPLPVNEAQPCLVAVGDSITRALGRVSFVDLWGWDVQNIAIGGSSTKHWMDEADTAYAPITCDPVAIHVMLGGNDAVGLLSEPTTPAQYSANLRTIVQDIEALYPAATIYLSQPPLIFNSACDGPCQKRLSNYREQLWAVASETSAQVGIDSLGTPIYGRMFPDGVHPDQEAHDILRGVLFSRLFNEWLMWTMGQPYSHTQSQTHPGP